MTLMSDLHLRGTQMPPRCLQLGLQLVHALNCGRHIVRIAFAQNLTDVNVSLQELQRNRTWEA